MENNHSQFNDNQGRSHNGFTMINHAPSFSFFMSNPGSYNITLNGTGERGTAQVPVQQGYFAAPELLEVPVTKGCDNQPTEFVNTLSTGTSANQCMNLTTPSVFWSNNTGQSAFTPIVGPSRVSPKESNISYDYRNESTLPIESTFKTSQNQVVVNGPHLCMVKTPTIESPPYSYPNSPVMFDEIDI